MEYATICGDTVWNENENKKKKSNNKTLIWWQKCF